MKRSLLAAVLLIAFLSSEAQQDPQYTQWMFDKLSFNPAAAGMGEGHCLTMFYRDQWDQFDRDPKTAMFNYNGKLLPSVGVGVTFYNDHLGQETNNIFRVSGSYIHGLNNGAKIAGGLSFGMLGKSLGDDWRAIDDPTSDPIISPLLQGKNSSTFDMGVGLTYYKQGEYYAGVSATHVNGSSLTELSIKLKQHMYFMGGYNFQLSGPTWVLRTNLLAKTDLTATIFDVNANVLYDNTIWAGLTYRHTDAMAIMAGYQTEWGSGECATSKLRVGYSYDMTTSEIKNYSAGSHELHVTYCHIFCKPPKIYRYGNPRFL